MSRYPTELKLVGDTELLVAWNDGQRRQYSFVELRDECPCAMCRERRATAEKPSQELLPVLRPEEARPLRVVAMKPVGNYAYAISFSDGHDTGIYTFELLRTLGREV
jgi:DUF971 family protein